MTLEISACTYSYRPWKPPILHDFSYQLPDGLTILLGPNGAGKSTLLKLGAGVAKPRSGSINFNGAPSNTKAYRRMVAWMPQTVTPMSQLTARDYVAYAGWLKGLSKSEAWERSANALERVDLTECANNKTTELSGGQLRRAAVAAALVHDARVLLLDEPTAGMDPLQRRAFREVLRELGDDVQVLMSTHDVGDLAEEADNVTVMNGGRIIHHGTTDTFLAHAGDNYDSQRSAEDAYTALLTRDV
ncbi:ATP-binding cassette domain-containing protein [Streptomyces prunicolor]|uniref:ATP-binding cassette domain-containing protein n=1 Tax=Streptomyces prunicolor TaxID=67348 RepID=UPI00371D8761